MDFVVEDCYFGKLSDNPPFRKYDLLKEFIDYITVAFKGSERLDILFNLKDIYFLVALKSSDNLVNDGERKWKDILPESEYKFLESNDTIILGFLFIDPKNTLYDKHHTEIIHSRLKGYKLANRMINKYSLLYPDVDLILKN